jgi:hypothetical protein
MNKNFLELKQQLNELSETINKFDSEAVQLRIVELLFSQSSPAAGMAEESQAYVSGPASEPKAASSKASAPAPRAQTRATAKRGAESSAPSASGAVAALARLVEGNFFNEKRTIGDVVKKCEEDFGVRYKSNAFSGPLSRYAASGVLKRDKNAEGKFAYYK